MWECGEGQTDTQTAVTTIHFASATLHASLSLTCSEAKTSKKFQESSIRRNPADLRKHRMNDTQKDNCRQFVSSRVGEATTAERDKPMSIAIRGHFDKFVIS